MTLPNFLIIGVQKSGTTSIYNYLKQHPQIYMSPVKETNFLSRDWEKNPATKSQSVAPKIDSFKKYCELFDEVKDEIAIGEASPNYLFHYDISIPLIQRYVPEAKLIAILRDPTERAHSDYLMHIRDAIDTQRRNLLDQIKYSSHTSYTLRKGFYGQQLQHFYDRFDRQKIRVYLYDDLRVDAEKFMQEIYRFLEVDDNYCPDVSRRSQVAKIPKNQTINRILKKQNPLRTTVSSILKAFMPVEMRQTIRSSLIELNSDEKSIVKITPEEREALVEFYRHDILQLQDLIDRDLSAWLKV
ncbi:sulfotransferase [Oscillatoria sp. FACHB-1406]|uniref:sulfotransferase family protein n=1 Tax=Oscillatoria sp. FACHB-1406 TaxID=2692846 RepID=UPI0016839E1C|nr:sulfotransferase [Oscillatoria sp. FACHB-1406]MBD2577469.1 sulfotransferase [Oscillatoria sp. FACHB-1406]